jgi:flagellar biosynthesis protein FlhF
MNVKRFVGKNAREAIAQARGVWGDQTVVLSNRPIPGGVEILAMAGAEIPAPELPPARPVPAASASLHDALMAQGLPAPSASARPAEPAPPMSTLSFQQFVRERQRRDAELAAQQAADPVAAQGTDAHTLAAQAATRAAAARLASRAAEPAAASTAPARAGAQAPARAPSGIAARPTEPGRFAAQALREEMSAASPAAGADLLQELKSMRGMIASQLASMAWFDTVRRHPAQTQLLRLMLGNGFSPALARQIIHHLPEGSEDSRAEWWLLEALARNLHCAGPQAIAQTGGAFAVVGPTGVGKTTTCAKIAAHFARQHGAAAVGLVTVDTYRMGATDQLHAFGRLMGIPVHTARDSASLGDLLGLLERKPLVLVDTVGVGQRDPRLAELFAALPAGRLQRLLVLNASAQAETLEESAQAYGAAPGMRCAITKLDEAVKCGGVVDTVIRHRLVVDGIANGQRVPEDWHAARAQLLVQKALMKQAASVFTQGDADIALMLTAPPTAAAPNARAEVRHA